jgi:hypothetical protein
VSPAPPTGSRFGLQSARAGHDFLGQEAGRLGRAAVVEEEDEALDAEQLALADGTRVTREVGTAVFAVGERKGAATVIFGRPGDAALLGTLTLELLGLSSIRSSASYVPSRCCCCCRSVPRLPCRLSTTAESSFRRTAAS